MIASTVSERNVNFFTFVYRMVVIPHNANNFVLISNLKMASVLRSG